ncbi:hypothetical protein BC937DRAFT_91253 [Endogone sp. FLAS-F59071]|nr:hypothetical protein BC937DRAFT_91253 [Endogone sp. FLAS-F59071]|eukprot:RUS16403.1 hypothetical protein BC937DRAFT_91253 [Endogone sp. FLAS-F59071]
MPKLNQKARERTALDSHADHLYSRSLLANPYVDKDLYWYTLKTYNFSSASGENALLSKVSTKTDRKSFGKPSARFTFTGQPLSKPLSIAAQKPDPESIRLDFEFSYRLHPTTATKTVAARALLARLSQEDSGDQGWLSLFGKLQEFLDGSVDAFEIVLLAFILSHEHHDQTTQQPHESTSYLPTLPSSQPQLRTFLARHIIATTSNPLACAHQDSIPTWYFLHPYLLARVAALLPDFGRLYIQHLENATLVEADATLQTPEHPRDTLERIERAWLGLLYAIPDSLELAERVGPTLRAGRDAVRERCLRALNGSQGVGREVVLGVTDVWARMFARLEEMGGGGENEPEAGSRLRSERREEKRRNEQYT